MEDTILIKCLNKENDESCIVCLKPCILSDMTHIYEKSPKLQIKISDLLELCGGFKINKSNTFPKLICSKCLKELHAAAEFRDKCQASIEYLMNQSNEKDSAIGTENNKNNAIIDEIDSIGNVEDLIEFENLIEEYNNNVQLIENMIENGETVQSKSPINENDLEKTFTDIEKIYDNLDISLNDEVKKESSYKYSCDVCGSAFKTVLNLRKHFLKHTSTWFTCIACYYPFTNKMNLDKHFSDTHTNSNRNNNNNYKINNINNNIVNINNNNNNNNDIKINKHNKSNNKNNNNNNFDDNFSACFELAEINNDFTIEENIIENIFQKDQFICNKCNQVFQSVEILEKHLEVHKTKNYICNYCGKLFATTTNLLKHLRVHENDRPYSCKYCDLKFKDKSNLNVHVRRHAPVRPHKCTLCEKTFSRTNLLTEHMRSHTGEKPFICEICNKAFSKKRVYVNHKMTHSDNKFCCNFCSQKYVRESQLNFHIKNYHKELMITTAVI